MAQTDEFDCFLDDILHPQAGRIYCFAEFRAESIEESMKRLSLTTERLVQEAKLSTVTVRKARKSQRVALESAISIARALKDRLDGQPKARSQQASVVMQPMLRVLELLYDGGFTRIPRDRFSKLVELITIVNEKRNERAPERQKFLFRDGPGMIEWLAKYYVDLGTEPDWSAYRVHVRHPGIPTAREEDSSWMLPFVEGEEGLP